MAGLSLVAMSLTRSQTKFAWAAAAAIPWSLAALTTPRIYPFFAAIGITFGLSLAIRNENCAVERCYVGAALALASITLAVWATQSYGSPWQWIQVLSFAGAHTPVDVAVAP
ncbi:MAG TPA: hypothetical protein VJ809_00220, partial [Pirellulales bacterium]|nr:hypothetical protein [Pirellulales bacterium]